MVVYLDEYQDMGHDPTLYRYPGVYVMFDKGGTVMYVGASASLGRRLRQHLFAKTKGNLCYVTECRYWYCVVKRVEDRRIRKEVEKRLIKELRPAYNINYNSVNASAPIGWRRGLGSFKTLVKRNRKRLVL